MTFGSMTEREFGRTLQTVLSPSRAIQSPEFLRGRAAQLDGIRKAFYSPGRQVFIHGYRGVGKTSLAQTAAFQQQSTDGQPIMLSCGRGATFFKIIHDMFREAIPSDPRELQRTLEGNLGASYSGFSAGLKASMQQGKVPTPETLNDAVRYTAFIASAHSQEPVVIIDEFDLLKDPADQEMFADYVKQVGDQQIPIRIIFCGIGESLEDLFRAHESAHRYFHTVRLDRLEWEPRFEIIETAARKLEIDVDEDTRIRIARISDGFPHYIHLLCEKLFWLVFEETDDGRVTGDLFEQALYRAAEDMAPQLKMPYEKATRKYTNNYEEVLWAVADNHQLQRPTAEILESYNRIMRILQKDPLDRKKFYTRMNNLKKESHGSILIGSRAGWYEYREKMLRGYARLRAEQSGVGLDIEHPLQKKRILTNS